jgi:sugar lactone lactonase YvrE
MVADKDDLFVASGDELCASPPYGCPNFAVTEVNGDSGAVVRVISGGSFDYPDAMVVDGPNLFIANGCGCGKRRGSVTEVNARTGALVRVIAAPAYDFEGPAALAVDGPDLYVANNLAAREAGPPDWPQGQFLGTGTSVTSSTPTRGSSSG